MYLKDVSKFVPSLLDFTFMYASSQVISVNSIHFGFNRSDNWITSTLRTFIRISARSQILLWWIFLELENLPSFFLSPLTCRIGVSLLRNICLYINQLSWQRCHNLSRARQQWRNFMRVSEFTPRDISTPLYYYYSLRVSPMLEFYIRWLWKTRKLDNINDYKFRPRFCILLCFASVSIFAFWSRQSSFITYTSHYAWRVLRVRIFLGHSLTRSERD